MYFTFKGTSSEAFSITVNKMPTFKKAKRRYEIVEVEGKDGVDIIEDGYEPYVLEAVITLNDTTQIDSVIAWLDGSGVMTRSDDPGKYVNATVLEEVDYERLYKRKQTTVEFFIRDPFRYIVGEANVTKTTFPATHSNSGTVIAKPLWKITGTGTVSFTSGGKTMTLVLDTPYVYVDSDSREVYYMTTSKNRNASGDFPVLDVGSNTISKTGTITEIVITPRSRYL